MGKNNFVWLCAIFLFNHVAQIYRMMYKSDFEEDEEGRVIDVIVYINVRGLKFEKGKRCSQDKLHLSVFCLMLRAIKLTETVQNVNFQKGNIKMTSNYYQLSILSSSSSNPSRFKQSTDGTGIPVGLDGLDGLQDPRPAHGSGSSSLRKEGEPQRGSRCVPWSLELDVKLSQLQMGRFGDFWG